MTDGEPPAPGRILMTCGNDARTRIVELTNPGASWEGERAGRERAEQIAEELAKLVAHEHRRAKDEQVRREAAEATAAELARLLAHEHADLKRERIARAQAEAQARELVDLASEEPRGRRFVNAHRPAPRMRPPLQRAL
jgi:hypothetical protein